MATKLEDGVLKVEVIAHAPTVFRQCQHCEVVWRETGFSRGVREDQMRTTLPEDLQREYAAIWEWVHRLVETYGDRVAVEVVDATSLHGLRLALRYRIHRLPAIVVGGREKCVGMDLTFADSLVARHLGVAPSGDGGARSGP